MEPWPELTVLVQTALGLFRPAGPPSCSLARIGTEASRFAAIWRLCRVPVSDARVALVEKGVVRDAMGINVCFRLLEGPIGERVDLDEARSVDFDDGDRGTVASLGPPTPGDDTTGLQLVVRAACGFNLSQNHMYVCTSARLCVRLGIAMCQRDPP